MLSEEERRALSRAVADRLRALYQDPDAQVFGTPVARQVAALVSLVHKFDLDI